jgi:hypothetical protein
LPFVFVLLLPLFTVPATSVLRETAVSTCRLPEGFCDMICAAFCPTILMIGTLAPGLLGMLTLGWSRSIRGDVRQAAYVATAMAGLRVAAPAAEMLAVGLFTDWTTPMFGFGIGGVFSLILSPLLWLITLVVYVAYGVFGVDHSLDSSTLSDDTSDEAFRSFAAQVLRSDPSAPFGPVLDQWRHTLVRRVPLRDSLRQVFDEEQRRAGRGSSEG